MPAPAREWSVVVIGGANADIAASANPLPPGVSSPGKVRIGAGGAGRNVAEDLSRLGVRVRLVCAVGTDPLSDFVLASTERAGVDVSGITRMPNRTNVYVAVISSGVVASAVSDMAAAESLTPDHLVAEAAAIRAADFVVVDANLAPATIAQAVRLAAGRALCLLPVSAAKASRMTSHLDAASLIVLGAAELQTLTGTVIHTPADAIGAIRGLHRAAGSDVVVTMGARGLVWAGRDVAVLPVPSVSVVDPTGAGDAVTAAVIYARLAGLPAEVAGRLALAAGTMTVTVHGSTPKNFSVDALYAHAQLASCR